MKGYYEVFHVLCRRKNKPKTNPISVSPQIFWGLKGYLKKQTQFQNGQNDVTSIITMFYGDFDVPGRRENKANSSLSLQLCSGQALSSVEWSQFDLQKGSACR